MWRLIIVRSIAELIELLVSNGTLAALTSRYLELGTVVTLDTERMALIRSTHFYLGKPRLPSHHIYVFVNKV